MERPPPIPVELWRQIPPHVQAVLWVVLDRYEARIASLEAEVAELKARLNQSSQNSSKPPSSDGPHVKRKPPHPASGRKRGGQPGHPAHHRTLVPVDQVDEVVVCTPTHCRRCGRTLQGTDSQPHRHYRGGTPPLSGVGFLSSQKHLRSSSQCVSLIRLRPRLRDEAALRETTLIEQRHQDGDPALAKDTDQA